MKRLSAETDTVLDRYLEEARAGAPLIWLRQRTGFSAAVVMSWRTRRGIRRAPGISKAAEVGTWALDVLRRGYDSHLHAVTSTVPGGTWEIPEFLLRVPLDYSGFCRLTTVLVDSGASVAEIACAFGIREKDVATAVELQRAEA